MAWTDYLQRAVRFFSGGGAPTLQPELDRPDAAPAARARAGANAGGRGAAGGRKRAPSRRRDEAGPPEPAGAAVQRTATARAANAIVIPRDQHTVSRKHISANALRVLYRLRDSGFQSYLVGGAVRDMLLGIEPKDFDVATDARPEQIRQLFRNCRLIGRRFRLAHIHYGQDIIEVATFRGSSQDDGERDESANGRLLRDNVYGSLEEDIFRRDFTANALYYDITDYSIRDEVGGVADIGRRVLRLLGDPQARFQEDPVRMLRAVRFAAKLGFTIEASMAAKIPRLAHLLAEVPPARLFDETGKLFLLGHAERSFELLREHGLLPALMPQVAANLDGADGERFGRLVRAALASSDARVRDGKPLTSGFLLAVLLWPDVSRAHEALVGNGCEPMLAWQRAADAALGVFCRRVAVPRRISLVSQDIWALQQWLPQRNRRRVTRGLAHPRFRAAWDFLVLRAQVQPELQELVDWWRQAQALDDTSLVEHIVGSEDAAGGDAAPARRRRRRRGGRRGSGAPQGADA